MGSPSVPTPPMTATRTCRLLYYGQPGTGKRENLRLIHQSIPPEHRLSVATDDPERQIAFRLRQESAGGEWHVLVQSVDVGSERFKVAGMLERPPFDGVIFVVHSGAGHLDQGLAAFESLKIFLDSWGLDLLHVPVVLQYNRRGPEETVSVDQLESLLNPWGLLSFPANSARAEGVRETLKAALGLAINHLKERQLEVQPEPSQMLLDPVAPPRHPGSASKGPGGRPQAGALNLDYGPPLPGSEIEARTMARSEAIFDELRPPLVVPVRIPRRLLRGSGGQIRILLEVEIED